MPRSPVSKLTPTLPGVPRVPGTRRQQYSASTKLKLVDVAEALFSVQGFAATSLDQVVAGAAVTKGALYHHFDGKVALFEAVFERVADDASARVRAAVAAHEDPWEAAQAGLRVFLDVVQEERYRRVVILEGPAVLGRERYREQEERSTFATVVDLVAAMARRRRLAARRGDGPDLRPDLLRRGGLGGRGGRRGRRQGGRGRPGRGRHRLHPRRASGSSPRPTSPCPRC